jgi:tol-pal system protein YbgF
MTQPMPQAAPVPAAPQPPPAAASPSGRRSDAFDPAANPNAPGAPRGLGNGGPVAANEPDVGAPGGRAAGEPLDLARQPQPGAPGAPATVPPTQTPRDEFDLGYGYVLRRDYALADETFRAFLQKYPADPLVADAYYWLGESQFQRQQYREAAETFLAVTTRHERAAKAPDALLRLGQSLAALKEKDAACAALGEVTRKYPRASGCLRATGNVPPWCSRFRAGRIRWRSCGSPRAGGRR